MNRKMKQYPLVWEWRIGVGYRHTITLCAMMIALSTTTIHAEYVTLWAKAEGGAITTLGAGNGDDEKGPSPGNCTECEVWDDYNEECVPLPYGTVLNDCRMCDGAGGVVAEPAPDGSPCREGGKCCNGNCIPQPEELCTPSELRVEGTATETVIWDQYDPPREEVTIHDVNEEDESGYALVNYKSSHCPVACAP